jgi:signal transduction histidine kinase
MKISRLPLGTIVILLTVIALAGFYLLSARAQSVIIRNQLRSSELTVQWLELKDSILSASIRGESISRESTGIDYYSNLIQETMTREEFQILRRLDSSLHLTMRSIDIQWSGIRIKLLSSLRDGGAEVPEELSLFLVSPRISFFEENLRLLSSCINDHSGRQRSQFSIQYFFTAIILILTLILLFGNTMSIRHRYITDRNIRSLTQSLIQVQENERKKIACELHDEVIQELASLKMEAESLAEICESTAGRQAGSLPHMVERFQVLIQKTRSISLNLRPHDLDHLGLAGGLKALCSDFSKRNGIEIRFSATGMDAVDFDFTISINLYRIVQESLNNIKKHSEAGEVSVTLLGSSPKIILRIRDNGKGFSPGGLLIEDRQSNYHLGLTGIQERVRLLSGSFRIISKEGAGTELRITIPALKAKAL